MEKQNTRLAVSYKHRTQANKKETQNKDYQCFHFFYFLFLVSIASYKSTTLIKNKECNIKN